MPGTLAGGGVFGVEAGDIGILRGTGMNDHAIAIAHALSSGEGHGAILRFVVGENGEAEGIGGEEAIGAGVPADGGAGVIGGGADGDAEVLAFAFARIIAPVRGLAPALLFNACDTAD